MILIHSNLTLQNAKFHRNRLEAKFRGKFHHHVECTFFKVIERNKAYADLVCSIEVFEMLGIELTK